MTARGLINQTDFSSKLEYDFARELDHQELLGNITQWWYSPCKFILAAGKACTYTPDFMTIDAQGFVRFFEVKGYWREDARIKSKIFAEKFPFELTIVTREKGQWKYERM